jgi:hypothetical protein
VPDHEDPHPGDGNDSDMDGWADDYETVYGGTDPAIADTDGDLVVDPQDIAPLDPTIPPLPEGVELSVLGQDRVEVYVDTDADRDTGLRIAGLPMGMDRMVTIKGKDGYILSSRSYTYEGDGMSGEWSLIGNVTTCNDASSMEGVLRPQDLGIDGGEDGWSGMKFWMRASSWNNKTRDGIPSPFSADGLPLTDHRSINVLDPEEELDLEGRYVYLRSRGGGTMEVELVWSDATAGNGSVPATLPTVQFFDGATDTFLSLDRELISIQEDPGNGSARYLFPWAYRFGRLLVVPDDAGGPGSSQNASVFDMLISFGNTLSITMNITSDGSDDQEVITGGGTRNPAGTGIVISEIKPKTSDYIELFNPRSYAINIAGWQINVGGTIYTIASGTIPAGGYLVINRKSFSPWAPVNWLPDTGASISLLNPSGGNVDQVTYPGVSNAADSFSRYVSPTGTPVDTDNDANDFYVGQKTPGYTNLRKNPGATIPEFGQVVIPLVGTMLIVLLLRRKGSVKRGSRRNSRPA